METKSLAQLLEQLKARDQRAREAAAAALVPLGAQHAESVVPALAAALRDRSCTVRRVAATSLGQIGPPAAAAREALAAALHDRIHTVRNAARQALQHIEGKT